MAKEEKIEDSRNTVEWRQARDEMLALREAGANNEALIKAAIKACYWQLEIDPTVRGVIELIAVPGRSPTTQTVSKLIDDFKRDLRSRLRIKTSLPDMPPAAKDLIEAALAALIDSCQTAALKSLDEARVQINREAESKVRAAEQATLEAQAKCETYQERISQLESAYSNLQQSYEAVLIEVAKGKGQVEEIKQALEKQVEAFNESEATVKTLNRELELTKQHYEARLAEAEVKHAQVINAKDAEISKISGILQMADKDLVNTRMHLQNSQAAREQLKKDLDLERERLEIANRKAATEQASLRDEIKELSNKIGIEKGRAIAADEQRLSFESANQMLQRENAKLQAALEAASKTIQELTTKLDKQAPAPKKKSMQKADETKA
jgi:chromosome segregation ATPase